MSRRYLYGDSGAAPPAVAALCWLLPNGLLLLYCAPLALWLTLASMENTTRLLARHDNTLRHRRLLIAEADDVALATLACASLSLASDDCRIAGRQPGWLPQGAAEHDLLIVILPKSRARLRMVLAALAGQIRSPTPLWLLGPSKGGIQGGVTELRQWAQQIELIDSARHCKLFQAQLLPAPFAVEQFRQCWQYDGLQLCSWPGVFNHGRLDQGTALLLEVMQPLLQQSVPARVLDIGCGAGILSAVLARAGSQVTAVDVSAAALAACADTLATNRLDAEVLPADVYRPLTEGAAALGKFHWLVSNPPFHQGLKRSTDISARLIAEAPQHLHTDGSLLLVANRGLPYGDWLARAFSRVTQLAQDNAFVVWRAQP